MVLKPELSDIVYVMGNDAKEFLVNSKSGIVKETSNFARGIYEGFTIPTAFDVSGQTSFARAFGLAASMAGTWLGPLICQGIAHDSRYLFLYSIPVTTNGISGVRKWYKSAYKRVQDWPQHSRPDDPHFLGNGL